MSCNAAIYTVAGNTGVVSVNGTIPLGTTIRRFGRNAKQNGDGISLCGDGYYNVIGSFTIAATAAGAVTVQAFSDGVAIDGAVAGETVAAAGDSVNLTVNTLVRLKCCDARHNITFRITETGGTVVNAAVTVVKL